MYSLTAAVRVWTLVILWSVPTASHAQIQLIVEDFSLLQGESKPINVVLDDGGSDNVGHIALSVAKGPITVGSCRSPEDLREIGRVVSRRVLGERILFNLTGLTVGDPPTRDGVVFICEVSAPLDLAPGSYSLGCDAGAITPKNELLEPDCVGGNVIVSARPTETPTETPTSTPTSTPTATVPIADVRVGDVSGRRGETVQIDVRFIANGLPVAAVEHDLSFSGDALALDPATDCAVNAALEGKQLTAVELAPSPGTRTMRASIGGTPDLLPANTHIYTCAFRILALAAAGPNPILVGNTTALDPGSQVLPSRGFSGEVFVTLIGATATPGATISPSPHPATPTSTQTLASPTPSPSPTASPSRTPTRLPPTEPATATTTPSATLTATKTVVCVGDCDLDQKVNVPEIIRCVRQALGGGAGPPCAACDRDGDGRVEISELVVAVNNLLGGCAPAVPASRSYRQNHADQ